jgi:hypothetical protein
MVYTKPRKHECGAEKVQSSFLQMPAAPPTTHFGAEQRSRLRTIWGGRRDRSAGLLHTNDPELGDPKVAMEKEGTHRGHRADRWR